MIHHQIQPPPEARKSRKLDRPSHNLGHCEQSGLVDVVALEVADDVDCSGGVGDGDLAVVDGDDDEVGDGESGSEVEVGGGWLGLAVGVDGQVAVAGGVGVGDVDGGDVRGDAIHAGDHDVERCACGDWLFG